MSSDSGSSMSAGEDQQLAIDQRQQLLQAEQEGTQKRTFSNWINSKLSKNQQEAVVKDLYVDIQNGHILLDLLEVLSGEVLPREKGRNLFQSRSNIESALTFLGKRSIKLINIHVEDIISGKPSIVLGLIWQIIVHFHIEGLASILAASDDLQPVKCDTKKEASPTASPSPKRSAKSRWKISAQKVLLQWAQEQCARVGAVGVTDFKSSWKNGQAFLAIIHSLRPDLVDLEKFQVNSNEEKLREAFRIAEEELKIPRLLEPEDVNVLNPDEKSIMTYVAEFLKYSKNTADPSRDPTDRVMKATEWLNLEEQTLKKLFSEMKDETYTKKYQEILLFMRKFNEQKRIYISGLTAEEQRLIKQSLENLTFQIAEWKEQLDRSLPPPLDTIESWLSEVENLMAQTLPKLGSHHNIMSLLQNLSVSFKDLMIPAAGHSESLRSFRNVDDNGVILVPTDKTDEMKARMEKILSANFGVLVDYRFSGHGVLALLEEGRPKLKAWKGKYKSHEAVESLLADYNEFVGEKQFMVHLEIAFQKFKELHNQLLTTEEYSDDPEIAKQYKVIESKYEAFVSSTQESKSALEKVLTCWTQFENNISLITAWLDEQHKIHPGHVPMEILSKWKSVHKSLNRDGDFLIERTNDKAASKLSHRLKTFNNRWSKYLNLYEKPRTVGNEDEAQEDVPDGREGDSVKPTEVSARALRTYIQTLQKSTNKAESVQACIDILSHLETLEKLTESVYIWAEGAEQVLTTAHQQEPLEESAIGNIQDSYENGISHQEQLAEAEMTIYAVAHILLSHQDLQHFSVDGLKINLFQAQEKIQELVSRLGFALHPPEKHLPEEDIKMNFERSKRDLETYITNAVTLLGQRVTPEEFISQYEKTVGKFSKRNFKMFLKAADQMRTISSDKEKLAIEEVIADLRYRWQAVHDEMESYVCELKKLIQKQQYDDQSCKLKTQVSKAVQRNGNDITQDTEINGSSRDNTRKIYEEQKRDLELVLQRCREKLGAESPREAQDVNELQSRRQELELLQAQLNKCWRQYESTSLAVEKLMEGDEKSSCSEARSFLQSAIEEVTVEMEIRIQSLSVTINVLLPIEQEVSVLCESNLQTPVEDMKKFTVSSIGSVYQDFQEFQSSVEDQIQQCAELESAADIIDPASPVDAQAVQSIVQQYKIQLGATSETVKEREALLKDLQSFLSSLMTTKWSIQTVVAVSEKDRTTILQKRRNIELLEKKVHKLRREAKELDEYLVPAEIYLEDPEHGGQTSCLELVDGFFEKLEIAKQAVLQELSNLDTQGSGMLSLNGASNRHLLSDDDVPSVLRDHHSEEKLETFTVSAIDSVLQEIKEVQNTLESEIQDLSASEPDQLKVELQATNEAMKEREATLKALGEFLSTLTAAKASIEAESTTLAMDREILLQKQRNLEELEKDIYRLGQEAEKLDKSLQVAEIILEDPEGGGATSCQKMISVFFDKLENAQQAVLRDLQSLQQSGALEALNSRQRALCKNIEDIQDQIDKIGLRDPTIHAVQQRMKSLIQLEKKLESLIDEKMSISNGFLELLNTTRSKDIRGSEECEMLWEDVAQNINHSKDQCEGVIELLRKFQSHKKELMSLIQKAETLMPCQPSYMGKENLQKILKEVKAVKQEFDEHSEGVEEISSICKKLHSQINKIKSFEESPFQIEANSIVDKWLDITEKLESYNENLKSAISLWIKILQMSEDIEQWSENRKHVLEASDLTREDILQLNIEAENHEKHIKAIHNFSGEIQKLLQVGELPFELQVIQTSLQSKVTPLSKFASTKVNILEKSTVPPVPSPPTSCSTDGEMVQISAPPAGDPSKCVNGGAEADRRDEERMDDTHLNTGQHGATDLTSPPERIEYQTELPPNLSVQHSEPLETLHTRLLEWQKRRENLHTEHQRGKQETKKQLDSFTLLFQEGQELAGSLEKVNAEMMAAGSDGSTQDHQWLDIAQQHGSFMQELQDTVQTLESQIKEELHYDSLSIALNNKMTSFYEELLNFASSSRENTPCEQKRQRLQVLRGQYEDLQKEFSELSQISEGVKQIAPSPKAVRIQEALDMHQCKMRASLNQLDYLKGAIELPPLMDKGKKKKPKKGTKKKTEHSAQSTIEPALHPVEQAMQTIPLAAEASEKFPGKAVVEPSVHPATDFAAPPKEPKRGANKKTENATQSSIELLFPSVQTKHTVPPAVVEPSKPYPGKTAEEPLVQPNVDSAVSTPEPPVNLNMMLSVQTIAEQSLPTVTDSTMQHGREVSVEPLVKPVAEYGGHPAVKPTMFPLDNGLLHHVTDPLVQPTIDLTKRPAEVLPALHEGESSVLLDTEFSVQLAKESSAINAAGPTVQPSLETSAQPSEIPTVQPTEEHSIQPGARPTVQPLEEPSVQPGVRPTLQPSEEPSVQPSEVPTVQPIEEPFVQPEARPTVQPSLKPSVQPSEVPTVEPIEEPSVQPGARPTVQPSLKPSVRPSEVPTVQPIEEPSIQPEARPTVQPSLKPSVQPSERPTVKTSEEPSVQPGGRTSVQSTAELTVQPGARPSLQPLEETLVSHGASPAEQSVLEPTRQSGASSSEKLSSEASLPLDARGLIQPTEEPPVQNIAQVAVPSAGDPFMQQPAEYSVQPTVGPSVSTVMVSTAVESSAPPAVEHTLHRTVQPAEKPLTQHSPEPSSHNVLGPSLQSTVELKEQSVLGPSSVVGLAVHSLASTSKETMPDRKLAVETPEQDSPHVVEKVAQAIQGTVTGQQAIEGAVKDAVEPAVLDNEDQAQPDLKMPTQPGKPSSEPTEPLPVELSKAERAKERKGSKGRKKKKLIAALHTADKQGVNGVTSPVEKTSSMDHSEEDVSTEFVQKEINQDASDSLKEVAKVKTLEERVKVTEEQQEANGQLQMRRDECESFRRQLETSLSNSVTDSNDSLRVSALLTTVEERLRQAETLSDDMGKVIILNEIQPLYDEIKSYMEDLSKVAAKVPSTVKKEKKTDYFEDDVGVNTQDTKLVNEPVKTPTNREVPAMLIETTLEEPFPHYADFQQQMQEILSKISHIGVGHALPQKTLDTFGNCIKLLREQEADKIESEERPEVLHMEMLERDLKSYKKDPLKLNVTELEQHIAGLEKLQNDISQIRSQESAVQKAKNGDSRGSELLLSKCEQLLNELTTLSTEKKMLCQALKSFQDALSAAIQSYQMLCKEKENLKITPTESHASQLDKITHFLDEVEKEKSNLHFLKAEQNNIGDLGISSNYKERMDTEVSQIEDLWEQMELSAHREKDRLTKEAEELSALKGKVEDIQALVQVQQDLLDQPTLSSEDVLYASLGLSAKVQAFKHRFNLLKNTCDLQMKRTWGTNERQDLENSLEKLHNNLENLEERVKDRQLTRCQTPDAFLEQFPTLKPLYSSLLWVKKSQDKSCSEKGIALLLRDVDRQTTTSKKVHEELMDKKSAVDHAIGESKHISLSFDGDMSKDFSSFIQQLQKLYEEQIIQSTSRLQLFETGQEKRKALFSEIEKLKELLQRLEEEAAPVKGGIFTATELCEQLNCLKAKTTEMEEIEGLVLTLLRYSQTYHGELKSSEQLYLNDTLRSLKSKARRIRRFEENTFCYTKKLLSICNEVQERLTSLHRNLNALQPTELKKHREGLERDGDIFEKKLQLSQNAVSLCEVHLSHILRYKDLFKDNGLQWDDLTINDLQKNCLSLAERSGHSKLCEPEQGHYQELLDKIRTTVCSLQKELDTLSANFNIIAAQVSCKKIKKINALIAEALNWLHSEQAISADSSAAEEQSLTTLAKDMDQSYQALSQLVTDYYKRQKDPQHAKQVLFTLNIIDRDLQEPFVNELDENKLQERLLRLEVLGEISKAEVQSVSSVPRLLPADDLMKTLQDVENTGQQIEKKLSAHIASTKETCNILQNMQKAIIKVAELFRQYEEKLHIDHSALSSPGEKAAALECKEQELNVAISEIEIISGQLKSVCNEEDQKKLDDILNQIRNKNCELKGIRERKQSILVSYEEKSQSFKNNKQKILEGLKELEVVIRDSFLQKPTSYKAALEQWEKSKNLLAKIQSYEEEILEIHRTSRDLSASNDEDARLLEKIVSSLWDRWMYLLGIARDLELYCDDLKQEWKFISELLEREVILLDNCQEEVLDRPEIRKKTSHLENSLAEIERFKENVQVQQLQLSLLKYRVQNIVETPGLSLEIVPVIKEIQSMQAKCEGLLSKAQVNEEEIEAELREREALKDAFVAVNKSVREVSSSLENLEITDVAETKASLEDLLRLVISEKEKAQVIMEKVQDRYAEAVPEELKSHSGQSQEYLRETEEKVKIEIEQCSPQYIITKKLNEITAGLKNIEEQLTVKSENLFQAKELQNKIWDEVDIWHSKLHCLESEVQDIAEEDPSLAQEWMDKLTEPLNYYQKVTSLAERRTASLNKAASKLEEYEDTLKSTKLWIQNTDSLINEELKDCSAKILNKHVIALKIALDDSECKQLLLDTISSELGELAVMSETNKIVESLKEVSSQVKDLQERILNVLPQIQYLTNEVATIENEVKKMEKKVGSIRTILTSSEIDEMSPKDHHHNGQVILENIHSIRGTVADIEAFRPLLPLSASGVQSLCVFRRMRRLLREAEVLEKVTKEQNELLEPIIDEMLEQEQEQEKLKHISKNFAYETPDIKDRAEELRKQMEGLNQKKEQVLHSQRSSVIEQLVRLQQEPEDQDLEPLMSPVTEGVDQISDETPWSDPSLLPSLVEELEDSSLIMEASDTVKAVGEAEDLNVKAKEDAESFYIPPVTLEQERLENAASVWSDSVKPEMILRDCQGKVTEVELWLQGVNLSLAESKQEPDMRQSLEQKLGDVQKTLQETEKKINSLLEGADAAKQGPGSLLEEAESLSKKLKALKISLESLQAMLQHKPSAEQMPSTVSADKEYPTEKMLPSQESVAALHTRNVPAEVVSGQTRPRGKSNLPEDITWSKWQYLQKELSHRTKAAPLSPTNAQEAEKEMRINFISRYPGRSIKPAPLEDTKHSLVRLEALSQEAAAPLSQEGRKSVRSSLFVWLCSVSQWLQKVEDRLDTDISREEASLELTHYEKLSEDLNSLSEEMRKKMDSLLKLISHEGENVGVLSQCYNDIRNWLVQSHSAALFRIKHIREELKKHSNYQNDILQLYDIMVKKKSILQQLGSRSGFEASELLKKSAEYETELRNVENQMSALNEKGEKMSIPVSSNQEIYKLQDVLDETWRILRVKQNAYGGAVISKSQVDSLLCGVNDLLSFGKEKILKSHNYKCASKEALKSHIQEHKNFFNILDNQVLLLQALCSKTSTPASCKQIAETAGHEVDILTKEADAHCINMMALMKEWDEFDSRYNELSKKMEALESMVPTKNLVEESEEWVNERLRQYQQIKVLLEENEPRVSLVVVPGKRLQSLLRCRHLDSQVLGMEQQWSQLTQNVGHELHRLEFLGSNLASYKRNSAELSAWLSSAYQKLKNFKTQSLDVSQDLGNIKDNLHKFFEFTCEVDEKSSLKTSVLSTGNQLLRLKEADPAMLKLSLAKYEEQWAEIIAELPQIQEKLQQLLLEKLPSLQAVEELMDWMKSVKQSTMESVPTNVSDIKSLLQKYKTLQKEMSHKQCIVDFVNQSLLQLGVGDVEVKRYKRTELAELLGTLNLQWNMLQGDLKRKIQHVEQTLEGISDQESRRQSINNWFDAQQIRLNKLRRPTSVTAAESALAECSLLDEQIKAKSNALEQLEKSGPPAGDHHVFQEGLLTSENLLKKRDALANQVADLKTSMHSLLRNWKAYIENYDCVKKMFVKLLYVLGQAKRPTSSLNCLNHHLKILQSAQEESEQHEENWSKIRDALKNMEGLCSPSAFAILGHECKDSGSRWSSVNEELSSHLQSASLLLQLWEAYRDAYQNHTMDMERLEEKCHELLYAKLSEDRQADTLHQRVQDLQALEQSLQALRAQNLQVSELADKVIRQNPAAADVIHSERQNTSHRIDHLERSVSSKTAELKSIQSEVETFKNDLEKLQLRVKSSADFVGHVCLSQKEKEERSELIKKHLLELRELSADIERLNEETFTLPLDDRSLMSLQNLNRSWEKTGEMALEDCREQRMNELDRNSFVQNYETWMQCVEKAENNLTVGIAGTFEELKKQQAMYEKLQAEIVINEHILPSFVNKALSVLESEEEEHRSEVILKLTSLKEKWQNVISLVQQRNREITLLLKQWWRFNVSKQRLVENLSGVQDALSGVSPQRCHSLVHADKLLSDFKEKERQLKRLQTVYSTMVEDGKDLLAVAEPESKAALQRDLTLLEDLWQKTTQHLEAVLTHFTDTALKRKNFEKNVEDRRKSLHGLKVRVDEPLPTLHEDLQRYRLTVKELEEALDEWGDSLKELDNMKAELSQYIIAEDGAVLKKQVEALHRQWEELCLRVSMRKQEIEDRLNAWNVFNEKNKELCDWLTQMEGKVLQTADVNIEEMIEKLQKDCMEEINLFSENKLHLKQIGDQLIAASNKARSTEIENKLNKVNDRWKHLFDVIGSRVKKLKETLVIIQQLDKNMSNLRTWLSRIESELSKPVIYSICDDQEINKKLEEQRDLQKDIELHSAGVASVLNICERLLHDTDACANETECDSIQQTTRSLDKRWRNICTMSMERRLRIEETWRLWQKFLEDYSKFDDWLKEAEAMAASPDSSDVLYTKAKEEQKKFEAFQRQIHERLTHLELINKQYRRLARENRTDAASRLKQMVHEGNLRWDQLQRRVASILRRLKHFTSQREDFEGTRDSILVWLTEMDLQLTNVEHFSESDIEEKMQQLVGFKQEITLNTNKIDKLIVFGEQLIQKSEAMDAVVIEDELEEIHRYCQEVFGRVYRFHERLTSKGLHLEEERETSENDTDGEDSREIQNSSWHSTIPDVDSTHPSLCHLMPPPLPHERSGRETPVSVDSIPLEWDPTVDVGGSSMHENEEERTYYNPLSDVEIAESPEAYVIMTTKTVQASSGKSDLETPSWHSQDKHMGAVNSEYKERETSHGLMSATIGTKASLDLSTNERMAISSPPKETEGRTSSTTTEQLDDKGLRGIYRPETHSGVIERWEIIQAQSLSNELSAKQNLQQWQQFTSDLDNISLWLEKTEAELDNAQKLKPSTSIQELEQKVKKFKDTLKAFDHYKALVLSANLSGKEFQQADDTESRSLLSRLHEVNTRWDQACHKRDKWRESLQNDLNQCEEFHETSHQLLLWLTEAESRRLKYQVADHKRDQHALLECQRQLIQLEEQLLERQIQANSLQDMSSYLMGSNAGGNYIEADERTHVVATKIKQLLKEVSRDLKAAQRALDECTSDDVDSVIAADSQVTAGAPQDARKPEQAAAVQEASKKRPFFYRVLRAALPLQLLLLLLLLLACMIPFSEEDFSCAQANNFARSFYPMLRYTNGPPPT